MVFLIIFDHPQILTMYRVTFIYLLVAWQTMSSAQSNIIDSIRSLIHPVSYTHLDVYKRQPIGKPSSFKPSGIVIDGRPNAFTISAYEPDTQ